MVTFCQDSESQANYPPHLVLLTLSQTPQESLYFIFLIIEVSCKRVVGCYLAVLENQNLAQFYGPEFVIFLTHVRLLFAKKTKKNYI